MQIHREKGTILGGVHLELTGEVNEEGYSVTECIGGSMELEDKDLSFNYRTHCDPRLNYEQSLGKYQDLKLSNGRCRILDCRQSQVETQRRGTKRYSLVQSQRPKVISMHHPIRVWHLLR